MPIQYDSKKIIPAPLVDIEQDYIKNGDSIISPVYRITLTGQMVAFKGSPTSSGTFHTIGGYPADEVLTHDEYLKSILVKQSAIRALFSNEGKSLEIQPWDGSAPLKCNPRIVSVNVPNGQWFNLAPYTVVLEADVLYGAQTPSGEVSISTFLSDAKEEWNIELADPIREENVNGVYSYRMTHTLSAVGKKHYETDGSYTEPWINAQNWVVSRLGIDWSQVYSSGVLNAPISGGGALGAYNHVRSQNTDELGGSFSVTESWVLAPQAYTEDFNVETKTSIEDGLTRVAVQGSYQGYESRDSNYDLTQYKYAALASFDDDTIKASALSRGQTYSGITLNIIPNSSSVGRNPIAGTIAYSYDYDNRPSNLISGAIAEVITVTDRNPTDVFASLPVLGREVGPVLQDMNTITQKERTLSMDVVVTPSNDLVGGKPDVESIIDIVEPSGFTFYKSQDEEVWNAKQGRYSRNLTWVWNPGE